jgi:hypothetical protein
VRIHKRTLIFLSFYFLAGILFAGGAVNIEAARMRNGIHKGRKAREFIDSVAFGGANYVLCCDRLVFYEDGFWEAAGSVALILPGMRIDAQTGYLGQDGFAVFSGSAYVFPNLLKINFGRLSFTDPRRIVLEDVSFFLDEWESERSFAALTLVFGGRSLQLELPKERISLISGYTEKDSGAELFTALTKGISGYMRSPRERRK